MKTVGEIAFEEYLRLHGLSFEFEKSFPGKSKKPDYTIQAEREYLLDIKDFERVPMPSFASAGDPYRRIRLKIGEARKKFKEFEEWPCCLVLYSNCVQVDLKSPEIMFGSMEGDFGFTMPIDPETGSCPTDQAMPAFHGHGRMIQEKWKSPQNTTISALITLRYVRPVMMGQQIVSVIVWENRFARHPLPKSMFNGVHDVRYWFEGNVMRRRPNQAL